MCVATGIRGQQIRVFSEPAEVQRRGLFHRCRSPIDRHVWDQAMKPFLWLSASVIVFAPIVAQAQENRQPRAQPQGQHRQQEPRAQGHAPGSGSRPTQAPPTPGQPRSEMRGPSRVGGQARPQNAQQSPVRVQQSRTQGQRAGRPPNFRPQHVAPFRYPRGYSYRRWSVGLLLPSLFLGSRYYYDGYAAVGIGAPPYGFRWVRYGSDLLLVNIRTGRISRVIYGAFY